MTGAQISRLRRNPMPSKQLPLSQAVIAGIFEYCPTEWIQARQLNLPRVPFLEPGFGPKGRNRPLIDYVMMRT